MAFKIIIISSRYWLWFYAMRIMSAVNRIENPIVRLNFLMYFSFDINLFSMFPRNSQVLAVGIPTNTKMVRITIKLFKGVSETSINAAAIAIATIIAFGLAHCMRMPS